MSASTGSARREWYILLVYGQPVEAYSAKHEAVEACQYFNSPSVVRVREVLPPPTLKERIADVARRKKPTRGKKKEKE